MTSTPSPIQPPTSEAEAARLAARYGLRRVDRKPSLGEYVAQLWRNRAFITELASAKARSKNENNYLGQLWAALNPLMLAGAYYLIFGMLLRTDDGVDNFVGFLVIGIFLFAFFSAALTTGSRAIVDNQAMIRALRFPRAALPLSIAMAEIIALLPALVVMVVVIFASGEQPRWTWLLMPVAVALMFLFSTGIAMVGARVASDSRDLLNLIPLLTRLLRYISGVFFSISVYAGDGPVGQALQYQPVAVYLDLVRWCMLADVEQKPILWVFGVGWAVLFVAGGLVLFWRAEHRYGRE